MRIGSGRSLCLGLLASKIGHMIVDVFPVLGARLSVVVFISVREVGLCGRLGVYG
jgi:hypothetical protein